MPDINQKYTIEIRGKTDQLNDELEKITKNFSGITKIVQSLGAKTSKISFLGVSKKDVDSFKKYQDELNAATKDGVKMRSTVTLMDAEATRRITKKTTDEIAKALKEREALNLAYRTNISRMQLFGIAPDVIKEAADTKKRDAARLKAQTDTNNKLKEAEKNDKVLAKQMMSQWHSEALAMNKRYDEKMLNDKTRYIAAMLKLAILEKTEAILGTGIAEQNRAKQAKAANDARIANEEKTAAKLKVITDTEKYFYTQMWNEAHAMNRKFNSDRIKAEEKRANLAFIEHLGYVGVAGRVASSGLTPFRTQLSQSLDTLHKMGGAFYAIQAAASAATMVIKTMMEPFITGIKMAEEMKLKNVKLTGVIGMNIVQKPGESLDEMYKRAAEYSEVLVKNASKWNKNTVGTMNDLVDVMEGLAYLGYAPKNKDETWITQLTDFIVTRTEAQGKTKMARSNQIASELRAVAQGRTGMGSTLMRFFQQRVKEFRGMSGDEITADLQKRMREGSMGQIMRSFPDPKRSGATTLIEAQWSAMLGNIQIATAKAFEASRSKIAENLGVIATYLEKPGNIFEKMVIALGNLTEQFLNSIVANAPAIIEFAKNLDIIAKGLYPILKMSAKGWALLISTVVSGWAQLFSLLAKAAAYLAVKNPIKQKQTDAQRKWGYGDRDPFGRYQKAHNESLGMYVLVGPPSPKAKGKSVSTKEDVPEMKPIEPDPNKIERDRVKAEKERAKAQRKAADKKYHAEVKQWKFDKELYEVEMEIYNVYKKEHNKKLKNFENYTKAVAKWESHGGMAVSADYEKPGMFMGAPITAEQGQALAQQFKQNMTPLQEAVAEIAVQTAGIWNTLSQAVIASTEAMFVGLVKNTSGSKDVLQSFLQDLSDIIVGLLAKLAAVWTAVFVMTLGNTAAAGDAVAAVLKQFGKSPTPAPTSVADPGVLKNAPNELRAAPIKGLAVGTPYVPQDMPAYLHRGERIIPAGENRRLMAGSPMNQMSNRPIEVVVDFGPGEMLRLSKKVTEANYRRGVSGR